MEDMYERNYCKTMMVAGSQASFAHQAIAILSTVIKTSERTIEVQIPFS